MNEPRILTIDGPSGSGKGTIAARVAARLGWHLLDSGALYRLVGLAAVRHGTGFEDVEALASLARALEARFAAGRIFLEEADVTDEIRTESAGNAASKVAAVPDVRDALLGWQREYARLPGLVADGRDMGTVVFPAAAVKIFLTASAEERARRRHNQLMEKGFSASLASLVEEIRERDERDANRAVAPLRPAPDAVVIDSTALSIDDVLTEVFARLGTVWPDLGLDV